MRPLGVVVFNVFCNQMPEVLFSEDKEMIQAFALNSAYPSFGIRVKVGGSKGNLSNIDIIFS